MRPFRARLVSQDDHLEGLARYGVDHDLDDERAAVAWGAATDGLALAPHLDPYVGQIRGIGVALFTYMRMLCGADTLKPDLRVAGALQRLGFPAGRDAAAVLVTATYAARAIDARLVELDQLLWYA